MSDQSRLSWLGSLTTVHLLGIFFLILIVLGTILLALPASRAAGQPPLRFVDALFTAVSSVCVTGLIVVDTGTQFSGFGQAVILVLIQLGGLATMATSTLIMLALGHRLTLRRLKMMRDEYTVASGGSFWRLFGIIAGFACAAEVAGAFILTHTFAVSGSGGHDPVWCGVFHSISAFCNAGFSLFDNSLRGFRANWTITAVVPLLIVLGSMGFPAVNDVVHNLAARLRGTRLALTLHTKVVLVTSVLLIAAGMAVFLVAEMNGDALRGASLPEKVSAAWFQSVSPRTAGFNTVDFAKVRPATLLGTMVLMFIGGSPGSTAGGIKTTTFAVLILIVVARLRSRERIEVAGRTVPDAVVAKASAVALLCLALVIVAAGILMMTDGAAVAQRLREQNAQHGAFVSLLFESISAFGTVGLSVLDTPTTGALTWMGKAVIMFLMFLGRLGPLAVAQTVFEAEMPLGYQYPEEHVLIG